jgi:hypothetical protein
VGSKQCIKEPEEGGELTLLDGSLVGTDVLGEKVSCPAEEGTAGGTSRDPGMGDEGEVAEARTATFEGSEDEVCTPFFHMFEAVVVHDKVSNDDGHNLVPIHEYHWLVLFDGIADLGLVKDMIEVGVGTPLVLGFGLAQPELIKFVVRVWPLKNLVLGRRVDRIGGQPLDLLNLHSEG